MPNPTRPQIEATFALPTYRVQVLDHTATWNTVLNARVSAISGSADSTSNTDNGVAFGSPANPSASVEMENYQVALFRYMNDPYWINKVVRIAFGFDTSDYVVVFQGPIKSIQINNELVTWDLGGSMDFLNDVKIYTPIYYRKPIATKTTIASQENPDAVGYVGGLINMAFWRAGGRPKEQQGIAYTEASPDWKFWYSCEQGIIIPDFSWFSGENTLDEVYAMARATGGQIYQDSNGTVRYTQPLTFGDTSSYGSFYTFTDAVFNGYGENITNAEAIGTLKLTYTTRRVDPMQDVLEDKTPRLFMPSETKIIELSPSLPIWEYQGLVAFNNSTAVNTMKAILTDNREVTPTIGAIEANATKVTIYVTNPDASTPMILTSIKIQGRPLAANDDLYAEYGLDVPPEKTVENNVYIQNITHATRLLRMMFDFYNELKPIISLSNVQFDTDRYVGEIVKLSSIYNNDPAKYFRITKIDHSNIGTTMNVDLVIASTLPNRTQMFIIGNSYSGSDTKQLGY